MIRRVLAADFTSFRQAARPLLEAGVTPAEIEWQDPAAAQTSLFATQPQAADTAAQGSSKVPRRYLELAELAALYRSSDRFAVLYRVLYRLTHGEP
ncbi:MAG TPA: uracil-DNA glycosylase, partial [Polyangiales bacterium]|nr:uracil-DNA glycosylase [Polyangiales bacterium]